MNNHLYRCRHDRRISGVAAGLAEFFGLDVSLMRILWFLSIFFTGGFSILLYLALVLIVPLEPMTDAEATAVAALGPSGHRHEPRGEGRIATFIGLDVIRRVSRLLHTPLMSLTNAISAIAIVGAIILAGPQHDQMSTVLGAVAVFASTTNIISGFLITDRMLKMFKKKEPGK